jgi:NADH-quinone oxidoreductase subunit N
MSLASFTLVLSIFKGSLNYIAQLSGLSRTQPVLAASLALTLFSMAGIPPLAGFLSKYLVLLAAIENQFYLVSIIAVLTSVISAFYYLRIIK